MISIFPLKRVLSLFLALVLFVLSQLQISLASSGVFENPVEADQYEQGRIIVKFSPNISIDLLDGDLVEDRMSVGKQLFSGNSENQRLANFILNSDWIESVEPLFPEVHIEARSILAKDGDISLQDIEKTRINSLRKGRNLPILSAADKVATISDIYVITLKEDRYSDTQVLTDLLSRQTYVEFAERIDLPTFSASFAPNDPLYPNQWTHNNTASNDGTPGADINTQEAWDVTTGSSDVIVAVLDSGVTPHSEFGVRLLDGTAYYGDTTDNGKNDISTYSGGHGTQSTGIIAAEGNNAQGLAGICWSCKIIPIRVLDTNLSGSRFNLASGITDAVNRGADVINMSVGYNSGLGALQSAVQNAYAAGVVMVASRGNYTFKKPAFSSNTAQVFPAHYPEVISVGALSPCDERKSATSCDGESWFESMYGDTMLVLAPGTKVDSTHKNGGYTTNFNGTSAAAPEVSGVVALMLSINPNLTPAQVSQILQDTAIDLGPVGFDEQHGYGKVNAEGAVLAAQALLPVIEVDLALSFTSPVTPSVTVGDSFSYDLTVTNPSSNAVDFTMEMTRPTTAHTLGTITINGFDSTAACTVMATMVTCPTSVESSVASEVVIEITPTESGIADASFSITNPSFPDPYAANNTVNATTVVNPLPDSSPVVFAEWNFDESSWSGGGAVSDNVGTNHGTAYGGAFSATSAEVPTGSVVVLDGVDDYIKTPIAFSSQGSLSISAWYQTNNVARNRMAVVGGNNGGSFEVYVNQGKPGCRIWNKGEKSIFAAQQFIGDWHHVVCVQDYAAGQTKLYVDGVLSASSPYASVSAGGSWYIGRTGSSVATYFQGMVDHVTMYNQVLNDGDVQALYAEQNIYSSVPQVDNSILGEWEFEQSSWTIAAGEVADSGASMNHAKALGGVQTVAVDGVQNNAANFDGVNDAILTPVGFSTGNDFTLSAWYKTEKATRKRMSVIGGNNGGRFEMYVDQGRPGCRVWGTTERYILAPESYVGVWTHVACVERYGDNPSTELYVNGVLINSTPYNAIGVGGNWYIGRPGSSAANYFNGMIDHPIILAGALDSVDVAALYNEQLADYPFETFDSSITAWYKFNDTVWSGISGDVSDAIGKNPALTNNGVSQVVKSDTDKVASFDGMNDYITTKIKYLSDTPLTLSAWVKTGNQTKKRMAVVGGTNGGPFEMYVDEGRPGCRVWTTGDVSIFSSATIDDGWHHLMCVRDSAAGQTRLYVDGVLSAQVLKISRSAGGSFAIGKPGSTMATYYEGLIDNVRIYDKALNDPEALALFNE